MAPPPTADAPPLPRGLGRAGRSAVNISGYPAGNHHHHHAVRRGRGEPPWALGPRSRGTQKKSDGPLRIIWLTFEEPTNPKILFFFTFFF
jgi:hypothetical protein